MTIEIQVKDFNSMEEAVKKVHKIIKVQPDIKSIQYRVEHVKCFDVLLKSNAGICSLLLNWSIKFKPKYEPFHDNFATALDLGLKLVLESDTNTDNQLGNGFFTVITLP